MNRNLVERTIDFHGLPLHKVWEGERGDDELIRLGLHRFDYINYSRRQKSLTFQDRAKRLKLHQFIAKKAGEIFENELLRRDYDLSPGTYKNSHQYIQVKIHINKLSAEYNC
jgi:hypothetical protein